MTVRQFQTELRFYIFLQSQDEELHCEEEWTDRSEFCGSHQPDIRADVADEGGECSKEPGETEPGNILGFIIQPW